MISFGTAWDSGFKSYGFTSVESLDDLKVKLAATGQSKVHLVTTDRWDNMWTYVKSIAVNELSQPDVDWLNEGGRDSDRRYLVCRL